MLDDSDVNYRATQVHYLRMDQVPNYPVESNPRSLELQRLTKPIDASYYLELYQGVGLHHDWVDRLVIPQEELFQLINREEEDVFILLEEGVPCGYVEFFQGVDVVEILYFGLFPQFIGRGLGLPCLRMAVMQAWSYEPEWIGLNTCDLDSERALNAYLNVGFQLYTTKTEIRRTIY